MALEIGSRLGHYTVDALIGEGGMGQVYQATDTKLNRQVALKILPEAFASDPDRLARFQREAQVLASLNHPNIGQIHGIEDSEGTKALVLELVEGPTLADRIAQGPIPVDEALPIAKQIAEALEAAHEQGVIHRDLKPANIKLKPDGTVKVLDFGLAKALDTAPEGDPSQSPTLTAAATQMGVIMGTAAYMSPEQARGKPVDKRADIWAFGAVLYEMLTGEKPFPGDDVSQTIARIIEVDPDWSILPKTLPTGLRMFLLRCLRKGPRERTRDIGDIRLALEGAFEPTHGESGGPPTDRELRFWQRPIPAVLVVAAVAVISAMTALRLMPSDGPGAQVVRFTVTVPDANPFVETPAQPFAISPDGRRIAYVAGTPSGGWQLYLRAFDESEAVAVPGSEGATGPFFSPDGEWLGFVAYGFQALAKVSVNGGAVATIAETRFFVSGASWGDDGRIVMGSNLGLFHVSADGGMPEPLTVVEDGQTGGHSLPFSLPGSNAVTFLRGVSGTGAGTLAVVDVQTGVVRDLGLSGTGPRYVSSGHLLYATYEGSLQAVTFDLESLAVTGSPVTVAQGIGVGGGYFANFDVSDSGTLFYLPRSESSLSSRLVSVTREGTVRQTLATVDGLAWYPRFSPEGTRVAFAVAPDRGNASAADLWIEDIERGTRIRLTDGDNNRFYPVWSPDGGRVAYGAGAGATNRVLVTAADGSRQTETLLDIGERQFPMSWSPDGNRMALYRSGAGAGNRDIVTLSLEGDASPVPFVATPAEDRGVSFSPDGRWLAYVSGESGQDEVYVRPYPGPGPQAIVSSGGGQEPVWSRDGSELFYRSGNRLMAVEVDISGTFSATAPSALFENSFVADIAAGGGGNPNYDASPDGRHFVFVEDLSAGSTSQELRVVLNWHQELLERVPLP